MSFFKQTDKLNKNSLKKIKKLIDLFQSSQNQEDFPLSLSLQTFKNLQSTVESGEELFKYLLEDIVFSSLYATYYEQILITIKENPDVALKLITAFDENSNERERIISEQTDNHVRYIENNGYCKGCKDCNNHNDLNDLLAKWNSKEDSFFIPLYLGMQTIQNAMEQLLYDFIIDDQNLSKILTIENVMQYRKYIYAYTQKNIKNIFNT